MTAKTNYTADPTVDDVIQSIVDRSATGMLHYGQSIRDNNTMTARQWLLNAREEMTDSAIYLTKLAEEVETLEYYVGFLLTYIKGNHPEYYERLAATLPPKYLEF